MTLRQYLEGLWSVGLDDLEFRRRPQVLLELDEEKRKRLGCAEAFLIEALAELSEAAEILERYDLYRVGALAPSAEVPLEVALAGCGLEAAGRFLDRPLREAVVWVGLVQVAEAVKAQLMQKDNG
uniref:Uncharacterized protein n=1 Tax=Rhodothermus marinus TaxID=29549 RepID=A0A7V2AZU2_RHOMR